MVATFQFRGPIPDWLNPETAGHRYWKPPEIPVQIAGRGLLDGASAIYAFAPEHLRHDLEVASEELRQIDIPLDPDRRQTLEWIEYIHRENQEVIPAQTPEFQVWCRWKIALNIIPVHIVPLLLDGSLRAFGEPDRPGSHPHWVDPRTWLALEADPVVPGRFAGHGLVFWNMRVVDVREVLAEHDRQETLKVMENSSKPNRKHSSMDVQRWFRSYLGRFVDNRFHPSLESDLKAARDELDHAITRTEIESLRLEFVPEERRPVGRRPKSPR